MLRHLHQTICFFRMGMVTYFHHSPKFRFFNALLIERGSSMTYCTNCGKETSAKKVCAHCGAKFGKSLKYCAWCGTAFPPDAKTCPSCNEPKRIGTPIGKIFRVLLASIFIFIGVLYGLLSILSLPQMLLPSLLILLVGIAILPFSQKLMHKLTHGNLKLRKIIRLVAPFVLILTFFFSMDSCMTIHGYSTAMKHWDETAYAAAMNYLVKNPEYKDSETYIEKFETDVTNSLMQYPWWSGLNRYGDFGDSMHYAFREDGTALRRTTSWDLKGGMKVASYEDFQLAYTLIYDVNDDTGVYEVILRVGPEHAYKDYLLHLGVSESGTIVVNGFQEKASAGVIQIYFSRDTALPE